MISMNNYSLNLCDVLYKDSGEIPCYDFYLKLTRPENVEKIEKLKLNSKGVFEREFWEDLQLSKNTFPHLRKISIKNVKFNLFNLKYFKNTSVQSFNFLNTEINNLDCVEFLLRENKRVLINDNKFEDTACMALDQAIKSKDYTYMTLTMETGSWKRKNSDKLAKSLLDLSIKEDYLELTNVWAKELNLTKNTTDSIARAISIIKHPLVRVKALDENHCEEMTLGYSEIINNPIYDRLYHSNFSEQDKNLIQIQMSKDCLENMLEFKIRGCFRKDITVETLIELAHLAEMYNWESLKKQLFQCKIPCNTLWNEDASEDDIEKFNVLLTDLIPHIPDFMKKSIMNQVIRFLKIDLIEIFKEGYRVTFDASLIHVIKMLPSTLNIHLRIDLCSLNLSTQEELVKHGPYDAVNCLEIVNSDDGFISSLYSLVSTYRKSNTSEVSTKIKLLSTLFTSCLEVNVSQIDYESYKEELDPIFPAFKAAVIRYDFV